MKNFISGFALASVIFYLLGLLQLPFQDHRFLFEDYVSKQKIGSSYDYWLVKGNSISSDEDRTALYFGYGDDRIECERAVKNLNKEYPLANYYCVKANLE